MTAATAPALALEDLSSGYGAAMVLRAASLTVEPGEILTVIGKNGMGKSTLLKTIMGFVPAASGRVRLDGTDVTGQPPHAIAHHAVAYAPQEYTLFQDLSVRDNLRLGIADDRIFNERLQSLADAFPRMLERLKQRAGTLSGGEQKMLLMSRALLARPKLMLIDEISEGLQPTMIDRMGEILRRTRADNGTAVLLVEQNLAFALAAADRFAVLKLGQIVETGATGDPDAAHRLGEHLRV